MLPKVFTSLIITLFFASANADAVLFINELDYDNVSTDTDEWVEIVGTAGTSLNAYELVMIDQDGDAYNTFDLAPANFTFSDETGTGWGFFVVGEVGGGYSVTSDFAPTGWTSNEIQNGATDSIQLRLKAGPTNIHLIDYEGNNSNTTEDQLTSLDDNNDDADTSIYLSGTGNSFSDFDFAFSVGGGTPGTINIGQTLTAIPEPSAMLFGSLVCGVLATTSARKRNRA